MTKGIRRDSNRYSLWGYLGRYFALVFVAAAFDCTTAFAQGNAATPTPPAAAPPAAPAPTTPAATPAAATPVAQPTVSSPPAGPSVTTVYDERIAAKVSGIEEGKLVVATDPVRKIPLDEIALVELGNAPEFSAQWVGQVNHDVVQVGGAAGGNGIQDVQIRLSGLADGKNMKQIVALTRGGKGRGIWRLDTARTPNWKLALERSGTTATADVYVEPINQDCFDRDIEITVTYDDGSTVKTTFKATTHTNHQLKMGAVAEAAQSTEPQGPPTVAVYGRDKSVIRGEMLTLDDESIVIKPAWAAEIKVPLVVVRGICFTSVGTAADRQQFDVRLAEPNAEDTAVVLGREKEISQVTGVAHGVTDGKLKFTFEEEDRSINVGRLVGLVYAKGPKKPSTAKPYQIVNLLSGDLLAGEWKSADDNELSFDTAWGAIAVPRSAVLRVVFRNGKVTFVSDLEPVAVEETPYFGRLMSYRRDQSLDGGALKLKGKTYNKGLAVHSRSVLTYAVDGEYESFKATAAFDESSQGRGRVVLRVVGDDTELFVEPDLAATAEPVSIDVPLSGIKQLSLEVDYGEAEDTGDRVIWADARLFRVEKKQ